MCEINILSDPIHLVEYDKTSLRENRSKFFFFFFKGTKKYSRQEEKEQAIIYNTMRSTMSNEFI